MKKMGASLLSIGLLATLPVLLSGPSYAQSNGIPIAEPIASTALAPTSDNSTLIKKTKLRDLDLWMQLSEEERILIVEHWRNLPETTRPAFPLYRTRVLEKREHHLNMISKK